MLKICNLFKNVYCNVTHIDRHSNAIVNSAHSSEVDRYLLTNIVNYLTFLITFLKHFPIPILISTRLVWVSSASQAARSNPGSRDCVFANNQLVPCDAAMMMMSVLHIVLQFLSRDDCVNWTTTIHRQQQLYAIMAPVGCNSICFNWMETKQLVCAIVYLHAVWSVSMVWLSRLICGIK